MRRLFILPISLLGLIGLIFMVPRTVSAHPLDVYLQAMYITLTGKNILVDVDMTPGVLIASQVWSLVDTNKDGVISSDEGAAYAHSVVAAFRLQANNAVLPLTLTSFDYPSQVDFNAGTGIIHLH